MRIVNLGPLPKLLPMDRSEAEAFKRGAEINRQIGVATTHLIAYAMWPEDVELRQSFLATNGALVLVEAQKSLSKVETEYGRTSPESNYARETLEIIRRETFEVHGGGFGPLAEAGGVKYLSNRVNTPPAKSRWLQVTA